MKFLFPVFALILFCKICIAEEDFRTWTSSDGRTLQARFVEKVGSGSVKIENATGKEFTLPKSSISEADWKYVEGVVVGRLLESRKFKDRKEKTFRFPKSLSGKGCVFILSLEGNVEVFDNPFEEGSFGGRYINGKYVEPRKANGRIPSIGKSISTGSIIITKANSQAVLLFTNGTLATLGENSRIILENLWQTPFEPSEKKVSELKGEPSQSRTALGLDFGELIVDVKKLNKGSSFNLNSPLGVAGIRGTQFLFISKDNEITLSVLEGLVEYSDSNEKVFSIGKDNSITTQTDKSSKQGKLDKNEKGRINDLLLNASQNAKSYDLNILSEATQNSSEEQKIFISRSAKNLEMIWCPPGSFTMGTPPDTVSRSEETQHQVILTKGFYLGKYEVTQEQYMSVMGEQTKSFENLKMPVETASWNDAKLFCEKLNELEKGRIPLGWEFTLPSEAQWEYACRAGTTTKYYWGDDINFKFVKIYSSNFPRTWTVRGRKIKAEGFVRSTIKGKEGITIKPGGLIDFIDLSKEDREFLRSSEASIIQSPGASEVGSYFPNQWGFYDMHGNIWEWCLDWHDIYQINKVIDPLGPSSGLRRVRRGGSWFSDYSRLRSAARYGLPDIADKNYGFRISLQKIK